MRRETVTPLCDKVISEKGQGRGQWCLTNLCTIIGDECMKGKTSAKRTSSIVSPVIRSINSSEAKALHALPPPWR